MTQAEYAAGNFKQKATEGQLTAQIRVGRADFDNVAGVSPFGFVHTLPLSSLPHDPVVTLEYTQPFWSHGTDAS
jgi:hypothetical protein